jgi:uncharacterized protein (TIGR03435 family)
VKLCTALVVTVLACAQESAPVFEVASIKPADPANNGTSFNTLNGGGLRVSGANLRALIMTAYNIRNFQLSGGPGWVYTERFNVLAKPDHAGDEGPADYRKMTNEQRRAAAELMRRRLQSLLSERFQLVIRRETKEMPIYGMVIGKNGVKMTESEEGANSSMSTSNTRITCQRCTMGELAVNLSSITGRPVRDETGLTGKYDFKMEWAPELKAGGVERGEGAPADLASTPEAPTLFTALQQVLGLKLEPKKGPVDMYVIERAEKPSEN